MKTFCIFSMIFFIMATSQANAEDHFNAKVTVGHTVQYHVDMPLNHFQSNKEYIDGKCTTANPDIAKAELMGGIRTPGTPGSDKVVFAIQFAGIALGETTFSCGTITRLTDKQLTPVAHGKVTTIQLPAGW
jgi:hypothetical protein